LETEQTVIGSDNYIPVCRKCYNKWLIIHCFLKNCFFLFSIYYIKKRFKLMNIYNILNINGTESNEE
jgi:hypothetical protein